MPVTVVRASDDGRRLRERVRQRKRETLFAVLKAQRQHAKVQKEIDETRALLYNSDEDDEESDETPAQQEPKTYSPGLGLGSSGQKKNKEVCYILSDHAMMDVLSLKVFVQPAPSINAIVHDRDMRLKMVGGDLFYDDDEVEEGYRQISEKEERLREMMADLDRNHLQSQQDAESRPVLEATIGQKLKLLHSQIPVTKHNAKSRFFDEINSDRVRYTKLGQSLHKRILSEHRTFEETLQHTLDYCNMYTDTLPPKVLYIDDEVKTYESDVTKRQKLKERNGSSDSPQRSLNSPKAKNIAQGAEKATADLDYRSTSVYNPVTALLHKIEKVQLESTNRIVSAMEAAAHCGPLPPPGAAAATARRTTNRTGGAKAHIHRMVSGHSPAYARASGGREEAVLAAKPPDGRAESCTTAASSSSESVNTVQRISEPQSVMKGGPLSRRVVQRSSIVNENEEIEGVKIGLRRAAVPTQANAIKVTAVKYPLIYANLSSNDKSQKAALRIQGFIKAKLKKKMEDFYRIRKKIAEGKDILDVKNKRSHVAGELVVDRVGAFIAEESKRKQEMLTKYGDANFERPFNTKEKLANFVLNNKDRGEKMLNKSAMKTMEKIALDASDKKQADYFARLSNAKWLLSLVVKMREYTKRGASLCPSSCYKMLYSVKSIIAYGFELTPDVFYSIVQNTITEPAKADHSKVIVHKAVKAFRDATTPPVSAEDFLRYLEQHEVTPCTELVSQIRALRKKRARKERILKERRNKLKAINRGNAHPTLSRQGSNQDLADGSETAPSSSYSRRHSRANIGVMSRQGSKSSLASGDDGDLGTEVTGSELGSVWDDDDEDD